jgi:DNA-binding transcriptional MerR regulator
LKKLITITKLTNLLGLLDPVTKKPKNYILRYWENEFKEIKPKIINRRRYYNNKQVALIKLIKFLHKDKKMSINETKKLLKYKINKLDDNKSYGLKVHYYKEYFKIKSKFVLDKINKLKKNG